MPKVAYSEQEREQIRKELLETSLSLMSKQGIRHTTIEQVYKKVGISKTFFYSFFPSKEDLVVEMLYLQQPKILHYAQTLKRELPWRDALFQFIYTCCYGKEYGIAVMSIEEQQMVFQRLSADSFQFFRKKQYQLFASLLECFSIKPNRDRVSLFINLSLSVMLICKAIPETLPMLVQEASRETIDFQIQAIIEYFEKMKEEVY